MNIAVSAALVAFSILAIILLTSRLKVNAFLALFVVALLLALATLPRQNVISAIKNGFGATMASIGLLIILGAIIGVTLDKTGGSLSIANYVLSLTGTRRVAAALGVTGFICGMPIFCNSAYIIFSGLSKTFSAKAKVPMPFLASVLGCSLYAVHCMIPTHPGPLAAAGIMQTSVGPLILLGALSAIPGAVAAFFWSKLMVAGKNYPPAAEIHAQAPIAALPSPYLSLLPIVVPLLLITAKSINDLVDAPGDGLWARILYFPGDPIVALAIGAALALLLVNNKSIAGLNAIIHEAIEKSGPILIVTAVGGMFGSVIKDTGVAEAAGRALAPTGLGLVVPFLIAAVMKTAQGSSTVAVITSASFMAPMLPALGLGSEHGRLLAMLALGAGSMSVSHANDSYFWVVANFAEIDANTALRVYSTSTLVMGLVVFACVWGASRFIP
jgi:GntP family gluconate:H+ symporter